MTKNSVFSITACLAIAMSACTTFQPPRPERLETAKACADWRWIGISRPGARCPDIPGWTVRPLFAQLSPAPQKSEEYRAMKESEWRDFCAAKESDRGDFRTAKEPEKVPGRPEVIRELNRFCVYEVEHRWLVQSKIPPPKSTELVRLDQDCASLVASGGPTDPSVASAEFSDLLAESRDFPAASPAASRVVGSAVSPVAKPSTITNPNGVRLAFLDTQPNSEGPPEWQGRSPHGFVLAYLGKNLVCDGERCAARITTRLALPVIDFNPKSWKLTQRDEVRGGYLGMQSDLADAIRSEVDDWWARRLEGSPERHLVLNLSLAWEGELFGGLGEEQIAEMRAGTQAVYRALQYAAGFDALVVAAAGNKKAEPCSNFGPLLPAAWETGSARDESCREPRQPLLYAVGGLGAGGSALGNARPGGIPRRVAYAENAVLPSPLAPQYAATLTGSSTPGYTASLTGSSVAAAVVSSIAAVVWAAYPEKSSSQIMEILDKSGEDLHVPADFWFGESASPPAARPNVHRLSLCSALQKACAEEPGCHLQVQCLSSALPQRSDPRVWPGEHCQPWLSPQPESPPCPSCIPP